jgi:PIN domain nuclease of toxin-antitoxin system
LSLLLDSNTLLWWLADHPRLQAKVSDRIAVETTVGVSLVSPWELWIKAASGRLRLPDDFLERLSSTGVDIWSPTLADAQLAADLPLLHRDPFDRMIVAQALNAHATLVTGDLRLASYGVEVLLT